MKKLLQTIAMHVGIHHILLILIGLFIGVENGGAWAITGVSKQTQNQYQVSTFPNRFS